MNKLTYLFLILSLSCSLKISLLSSGIDIFFNGDLSEYKDKNIALVMNHTSINKEGKSLFDLAKLNLNVISIFTPEHGLFGKNEAGEIVANTTLNQIPVHSLYGGIKGPTNKQLSGVDVLIVARIKASLAGYKELNHSLFNLTKKAGIVEDL